jgi:hypothetical protein
MWYKEQDTGFEHRGPTIAGPVEAIVLYTYIDASAVLHLCRAVPRHTGAPNPFAGTGNQPETTRGLTLVHRRDAPGVDSACCHPRAHPLRRRCVCLPLPVTVRGTGMCVACVVRRVVDRPWRLAACTHTMRDGTKSARRWWPGRAVSRRGENSCVAQILVMSIFLRQDAFLLSLPTSCRVRCARTQFSRARAGGPCVRDYRRTHATEHTRTADPALARYRDARGAARSDANAWSGRGTKRTSHTRVTAATGQSTEPRKESEGATCTAKVVLHREGSVSRSTALVASELLLPAP